MLSVLCRQYIDHLGYKGEAAQIHLITYAHLVLRFRRIQVVRVARSPCRWRFSGESAHTQKSACRQDTLSLISKRMKSSLGDPCPRAGSH